MCESFARIRVRIKQSLDNPSLEDRLEDNLLYIIGAESLIVYFLGVYDDVRFGLAETAATRDTHGNLVAQAMFLYYLPKRFQHIRGTSDLTACP